ncbi:phenylpyruvate tautomerase MIF-related protein [Rodentibacter caecimuris]|uniref:phenylpyruvate tautomerase MIF-related protein n=1 Tax=Rodentibacter caecimuris TaxID=1796644 RepID=UPI0009872174|nr:hypothetical protein BKG97_09885 [Rodentibacter heylii]
MPFINVQTNLAISEEHITALKAGLGKLIAYIPHKSEQSLMINFHDNARLYLKGDHRIAAVLITVSVFANPQHLGYQPLAQGIAQLFYRILGIPLEQVYVKFEDILAWSVAGQLFLGAKC